MDIEPGTIIAKHYRVQRQLGRGGMGEVFAAENIRTGRVVAVKLLRSDTKQKESAVARFRREARASGAIHSDYVTQVLDVDEDPEHGIIIVFELLEGESLIDRLKRTGPMTFDEIFPVVEQVWIGLADAHKSGVIHRDLKPSNVFLEKRPDGSHRVKILDFGISKIQKDSGDTLTEMGQNLGTFSFMPPEQIGKAKTVDHRADIYACATLIYQAMSGQLPYAARNILMIVELKSKAEPRALSQVMETPVDPRLEEFLSKSLKRDPQDRFQSALEALEAWRALKAPAPAAAPQPAVSINVAPTVPDPRQLAQPTPRAPQPAPYAPSTPSGAQPVFQRQASYSGMSNIPSVVAPESSNDAGDNVATVAIPMRKVAEALQQRAQQGNPYAQPRPAGGVAPTLPGAGLPRLHEDNPQGGTAIMAKSGQHPAAASRSMGTIAMPAQTSAPTQVSAGYAYSGAASSSGGPVSPHVAAAQSSPAPLTPGIPSPAGGTGPSGTARHVPVRVEEPAPSGELQTAVFRRGRDAPTVITAGRRKQRSKLTLALGMLAFLVLGFVIVMAVVGLVTHKFP